jgi:hypothetical protein
MTGAGATGAIVIFKAEGSDGGRLLERVLVMVSIFCKRRLRSKNLRSASLRQWAQGEELRCRKAWIVLRFRAFST